ncbi:S41 family peptidase [Patescibacteria group bacterium]|jgi:carboxyl-terminal processing protease|nr:S41 family peptidase [Patescibacteria group bacterium]MCL5114233.1 S41 family peptidase [Patescibacteria group bacterium]
MKKIWKGITAGVAVLLFGAVLFYVGFRFGNLKETYEPQYSIPANGTSTLLNANFSLFWDAIQLVKEKYYNPSAINDNQMLYGAINGALSSLGDPYSVFFSPSDSTKFDQDLSGSFGGIGAEIGTNKNNQLVVISPLKGTPAEAAGLRAGDQILQVNGTSTTNMSPDEAVKIIRGDVGTKVNLLIMREGWQQSKTFTITRALINVPTLDWKMLPGNIADIQLYNFDANAGTEFYNAALQALLQNAHGMILDLRDNPGGFLDVAQNIAGWFLKRGSPVVIEKFRGSQEQTLYANGNAALSQMPVVLLVNGGSASAAEILSGALRDNRGIKLVGVQTFGKGSVQEIENLPDGASMKVSIAEWLTPNGTAINKIGLKPDYIVPLTDQDIQNKQDPQLQKAIEVLQQEMK